MRLAVFLLAALFCIVLTSCKGNVAPPPASTTTTASAPASKPTVVTATLDQPIEKDKNVIWCASFQLAWNELVDFSGGPIQLNDPPPMAAALNQRIIDGKGLDPKSFFAIAGRVQDGVLEKAAADMSRLFPDRGATSLLPAPGSLSPEAVVAYAYFQKHLPFEFAFVRTHGMFFGPTPPGDAEDTRPKVESFGFDKLVKGDKKGETLAAQVKVIWHKFSFPDKWTQGDQQFILELLTTARNDRMILAMVEPGKDLSGTIKLVMEHMAKPNTAGVNEAKAAGDALHMPYSEESFNRISSFACLLPEEGLSVPIIDLNLVESFAALQGKVITSKNPKLNGMQIRDARQLIRFRLDEMGAEVKWKSALDTWGGPERKFTFDRPFLVMLMQKEAKQPYFAMWVGNAELLAPADRD